MPEPTLVFDFRPLTWDLARSADYTSTTLYSAISAQLFRHRGADGHIRPAACASFRSNPEATEYHLSLAAGLSWPDGSSVAAAQYADRIKAVVTSGSPIGTRFAGLLAIDGHKRKGATGSDVEVIRIRLASPDYQLRNKLAHAALGPLRSTSSPEDYPDAAGPFTFDNLNQDSATLRRRYGVGTASGGVDRLKVRFIVDPEEAISLYMKGEVDSTCPVSFPFDRIAEFADHNEFFSCPTTTFFVLVPTSDRSHAFRFRHMIWSSLDLDAIVAVAPLGLSPWRTFLPLAPDWERLGPGGAPCRGERPEAGLYQRLGKISLAVDDFEPNLKIASEMAKQLRTRGCEVEVILDSFEKPMARCDLRLCVLSNSRSYQADLYRRLSHSPVIQSDPGLHSRYTALIDDFDAASSDAERWRAVSDLDDIIAEQMPIIPIAGLGQFYLKRRALERFDWAGDASWMRV